MKEHLERFKDLARAFAVARRVYVRAEIETCATMGYALGDLDDDFAPTIGERVGKDQRAELRKELALNVLDEAVQCMTSYEEAVDFLMERIGDRKLEDLGDGELAALTSMHHYLVRCAEAAEKAGASMAFEHPAVQKLLRERLS